MSSAEEFGSVCEKRRLAILLVHSTATMLWTPLVQLLALITSVILLVCPAEAHDGVDCISVGISLGLNGVSIGAWVGGELIQLGVGGHATLHI